MLVKNIFRRTNLQMRVCKLARHFGTWKLLLYSKISNKNASDENLKLVEGIPTYQY